MMWGSPLPLMASPGGPPQLYEPISDVLTSNVAFHDIVWAKDYRKVLIGIDHLLPVVSGGFLRATFSSDGGATFDVGATDYRYEVVRAGAVIAYDQVTTAAFLQLIEAGDGISVSADHGYHGDLVIAQPLDAKRTIMHGMGGYRSNASHITTTRFYGLRLAASRVDAVRFFVSNGNILTGRFWARGVLPYGEGEGS